jgi:hypothetical protein
MKFIDSNSRCFTSKIRKHGRYHLKVKVGHSLPEVKLFSVSFNPSEFHKKGVGLMQNHQLPILIQIETTYTFKYYSNSVACSFK